MNHFKNKNVITQGRQGGVVPNFVRKIKYIFGLLYQNFNIITVSRQELLTMKIAIVFIQAYLYFESVILEQGVLGLYRFHLSAKFGRLRVDLRNERVRPDLAQVLDHAHIDGKDLLVCMY